MGLARRAMIPVIAMVFYGWNMRILDGLCTQSFITTELAKHVFTVSWIDVAATRFELLLRWSSLPSAHFRVLFVVNVEQTWLSNVAAKQKAKQTNKQIKQTNKTTSMSSSHIVLELAPILNTFVCVWWVRSIPYSVGARSHNALCSHFFYCHFGSVSFDLAVWCSFACGYMC